MDKVWLCACEEYDFEKIKSCVDEAFETLSLGRLIRPGMKVVIKPNLVVKSAPEAAIATHPLVTAAVGVKLRELGAKVLIAESPGGAYLPAIVKGIYAGCGYEKIAKIYDLALNEDFSEGTLEVPDGRRCRSFPVITPILEADLIVNIAKLKSHCMTMISGAVKNMFGCVPGFLKPELHCRFPEKPDFGEMLADLCCAVGPSINFVDAITAMEGNGPSGGSPVHIGALMASENPFALDMVGVKIMNMQAENVFMLRSGMERGVCPKELSQIELLGAPIEKFIKKDFLQPESKSCNFAYSVPKFMRPLVERVLTPVPKIRVKKCVGCGRCRDICPQKTIRLEDGKAVIEYENCIRCYCCHEMCPMHAIDIRRLSLFSL